jgi:S-adenosylmethionine decarboxylase
MISVLNPERVFAKKLIRGVGEMTVETPPVQLFATVK